ncbi:MAG: 50S ribosomal protein L23 [Mycoplasmataceae bacterium]|jgi:ribosomal protein L23|nr:50S ribosomal protein L23 [Mycoplasmataceae bacterium]
MEFTKIIIQSYQTEKSYALQNSANPKYAFVVDPEATKHDIKLAFFSIYGHKPVAVSTQLKKPTHVRSGTMKPGFSKLTKIAYITLAKGTKLVADDTENTKVAAPATESSIVNTSANENVVKKEVKTAKKTTNVSKASKKEVSAEAKK